MLIRQGQDRGLTPARGNPDSDAIGYTYCDSNGHTDSNADTGARPTPTPQASADSTSAPNAVATISLLL